MDSARRFVIRAEALRPVACAIGFLVASAAALSYEVRVAHASILPDLTQPLVVATNWHATALLPLATLFAYAIAASVWGRAEVHSRPALGTVLACALLVPCVFSSDVYAYAAYGAQALHGANPYSIAIVPEPFTQAVAFQWPLGLPPCVYGPAFVALAGAVVAGVSSLGIGAVLFVFRLLACAGLMIAVEAFRRRGERGAAMLAWHPACIWAAAEGHNDMVVLACVAWAWTARATWVRTLLLTLGATIKSVATVGMLGIRLPWWSVALVAIGALAAPVTAAFAHAGAAHAYFPQVSFQAVGFFLARSLQLDAVCVPLALCLAGAVATASAVQAVRAWRAADAHASRLYAAFAVWALLPNPQPWYAVWLVALAALEPAHRLTRFALVTAVAAFLRYVPDAWGVPSDAPSLALATLACAPVVVALVARRRRLNTVGAPRT